MLILAFGIQLAYASRNAITQFRVSDGMSDKVVLEESAMRDDEFHKNVVTRNIYILA